MERQKDNNLDPGHLRPEDHIRLGRELRVEGEYDRSVEQFMKAAAHENSSRARWFSNWMLNEIEISQRKTVLESKPGALGIALTTRCNIRCIMCGSWNQPWDLPEEAVREIYGYFPYLQRVFWQGGEVFLSGHFEGLFDRASEYPDLHQVIVTNGHLIDDRWARKLAAGNVSVTFSIDGATKGTYEYIRRGSKYDRLLKNIGLINKYRSSAGNPKMSTEILMVVMRSNYREIGLMVDFAKEHGFKILQYTPIRQENGSEDIYSRRDEAAICHIREKMPGIMEKAGRYGIEVINTLPGAAPAGRAEGSPDAGKQEPPGPGPFFCLWPWQHLFIDTGGRVKPFCFCCEEVGDIASGSLDRIWNNDIMQEYRRRIIDRISAGFCDDRCVSGAIAKTALGLNI
ncbi:MAG: radical SAM protein [Elusimicrobia bacterium]|nr:radical SAM protein [Elusimicrobiota bacterium]